MVRGTKVLPGYGKLEPLRQGSLDRLCGLYAVINAMMLAAYPVSPMHPARRRILFDDAIGFLERRGRLETANLFGMTERLWMSVREQLHAEYTRMEHISIQAIPLFPGGRPQHIDCALNAIIQSIDSGAPVSLILWGQYDHFTVVAGYTPSNLLLFDSWGFRWIGIRSLALRHPRNDARHKLTWRSPASIVVQA